MRFDYCIDVKKVSPKKKSITDYAHEADGHAEQQFPPVHGRAVVHPVEAVLARLEQSIKTVRIERSDAFMVHAEQA